MATQTVTDIELQPVSPVPAITAQTTPHEPGTLTNGSILGTQASQDNDYEESPVSQTDHNEHVTPSQSSPGNTTAASIDTGAQQPPATPTHPQSSKIWAGLKKTVDATSTGNIVAMVALLWGTISVLSYIQSRYDSENAALQSCYSQVQVSHELLWNISTLTNTTNQAFQNTSDYCVDLMAKGVQAPPRLVGRSISVFESSGLLHKTTLSWYTDSVLVTAATVVVTVAAGVVTLIWSRPRMRYPYRQFVTHARLAALFGFEGEVEKKHTCYCKKIWDGQMSPEEIDQMLIIGGYGGWEVYSPHIINNVVRYSVESLSDLEDKLHSLLPNEVHSDMDGSISEDDAQDVPALRWSTASITEQTAVDDSALSSDSSTKEDQWGRSSTPPISFDDSGSVTVPQPQPPIIDPYKRIQRSYGVFPRNHHMDSRPGSIILRQWIDALGIDDLFLQSRQGDCHSTLTDDSRLWDITHGQILLPSDRHWSQQIWLSEMRDLRDMQIDMHKTSQTPLPFEARVRIALNQIVHLHREIRRLMIRQEQSFTSQPADEQLWREASAILEQLQHVTTTNGAVFDRLVDILEEQLERSLGNLPPLDIAPDQTQQLILRKALRAQLGRLVDKFWPFKDQYYIVQPAQWKRIKAEKSTQEGQSLLISD